MHQKSPTMRTFKFLSGIDARFKSQVHRNLECALVYRSLWID